MLLSCDLLCLTQRILPNFSTTYSFSYLATFLLRKLCEDHDTSYSLQKPNISTRLQTKLTCVLFKNIMPKGPFYEYIHYSLTYCLFYISYISMFKQVNIESVIKALCMLSFKFTKI